MEADSGEGRRFGLGRETKRIQPLNFCGCELAANRALRGGYIRALYTELEPLPLSCTARGVSGQRGNRLATPLYQFYSNNRKDYRTTTSLLAVKVSQPLIMST